MCCHDCMTSVKDVTCTKSKQLPFKDKQYFTCQPSPAVCVLPRALFVDKMTNGGEGEGQESRVLFA